MAIRYQEVKPQLDDDILRKKLHVHSEMGLPLPRNKKEKYRVEKVLGLRSRRRKKKGAGIEEAPRPKRKSQF